MVCLAATMLMATAGPKWGMAMGLKEGAGEEDFLVAMRQQIRIGLDGLAFNLKWDEFEAQSGKPLIDAASGTKFTGQEMALTIGTIDTVKRRLPADVQDMAWDDPRLQARFDAFLEKAVPIAGPTTRIFSLGNEVNAYFQQHPEELNGYVKFLSHARLTVRRLNPKALVGVTVTCSDAMKRPEIAERLQEGMDLTVFTYYPMDGLKVMDPAAVPSHFDFMTKLAGNRPMVLQEIGYPAASAVGSSEEKQAEFVRRVFTQVDRYQDRILMASYFSQMDFTPPLMRLFETYYGSSDPTFLAFLGSLGLCDAQGKPRAAWKVFCDGVQIRKPVR